MHLLALVSRAEIVMKPDVRFWLTCLASLGCGSAIVLLHARPIVI
jgi:hypothetical protein